MYERASFNKEKFNDMKFEEAKCSFAQEIKRSKFTSKTLPHEKDPNRKLHRSEIFFSVLEVLNLYGLKETLYGMEERFSNAIIKNKIRTIFINNFI